MPHPPVYGLPPDVIDGVPSQAELDSFPRMFTWDRLKSIILECDLVKLKRNPELQQRYDEWNRELKKKHGSVERYILDVRLPKEFTETCSVALSTRTDSINGTSTGESNGTTPNGKVALSTSETEHDDWVRFVDLHVDDLLRGGKGMCLLPNDWPYNVPYGVRHSILWTKKPIFHKSLVNNDDHAWRRILDDGFSGLTGRPRQEDWFTPGGQEIHDIVKALWDPEEFECAWFVNPPRLQSVRGVSHAHIFARNRQVDAAIEPQA